MAQVAPYYTIADLNDFPEDGNRYELLGGALLVTPAPGPPHQAALGRLTMALASYLAPSGLAVLVTPASFRRTTTPSSSPTSWWCRPAWWTSPPGAR